MHLVGENNYMTKEKLIGSWIEIIVKEKPSVVSKYLSLPASMYAG